MCALTAMPAAKGLFHKAVVLSGASLRMGEKELRARSSARRVLAEAGLAPAEVGKLQQMPWKDFYALATKARRRSSPGAAVAAGMRRGFNPVVDGVRPAAAPLRPRRPRPPQPTCRMLICSTFHEQSPSWTDSSLEAITLDEVVEKVKLRAGFGPGFGDKARDVVDAYAKAFPGRKPVEIWSLVSSNRQSVVALADAKSQQPAPVYVGLVRLAAAAVRRPHARLPLRRHLLLVREHRPDAEPHGRRARGRAGWPRRWPARCCSS